MEFIIRTVLFIVMNWEGSTNLVFVYMSSVYSPFTDGVGLTLHNILSPGVLVKSIGAEFFLRSDALPDVNHMRGMQYQIIQNFRFWPKLN